MTDEGGQYAPGWYPDPAGRHESRWFDGTQWTDHVASNGRQQVDPLHAAPPAPNPVGDHAPDRVVRQVQQQAGVGPTTQGGGTIFTEPVLVVNQKAKVIEVNTEYAVHDQHGTQIAAVRQVGQSTAKKVMRVLGNVDQFMTHSLQVVDAAGTVLLTITRPAKLVKSRLQIGDGAGNPIGEVVQQNAIGKIRFSLEAGGHTYGEIRGENWRAWNFAVVDHTGAEVARITKTWEGMARTMFTTADNYVLEIHRPLEEPLRSLVVASALCVDTALKQDSRGFS